MLANSLLIRFSSSSLARAFLRSAMNETRPVPSCKPLSVVPSDRRHTSHSGYIARLVPAEQSSAAAGRHFGGNRGRHVDEQATPTRGLFGGCEGSGAGGVESEELRGRGNAGEEVAVGRRAVANRERGRSAKVNHKAMGGPKCRQRSDISRRCSACCRWPLCSCMLHARDAAASRWRFTQEPARTSSRVGTP